ncbi:TonB-dependent receptor plug domain-containing protein [Kordiimonas sp.]|uniref:TonB-dependent receptor plug domain-containing protein n=1 Tax=Kordiimonas sp. TaxID=1970157 RepID=UPI003A905F6E
MRQNRLFNTTALAAGCICLSALNPAYAQDESDSMMEIEEVVVTGTYLKGKNQFNSPSPIAVIGSENLNQIGASNVADLVQTLTINNGAQNNPDAFTQNGTSGTSNFNLRGLGVASTLVLLNGRRQVVAGTTTNDGIAFVDTSSLVPQIAVRRIEIVKDGAAAIYGTDAVAGVVNFITDDQFEGVEVSAKYQMVTDEGSQSDQLYEAKFGFGGENTHFMGAFSYYDRSPLTTAERRFSTVADDSSVLGNPGSYYVPSIIAAIGTTAPVIDPYGCEEFGGIPDVAVPLGNGLNVGTCGFNFGDYYSLVPEEERKQAYAVITQDLGDGHQLRLEGGWADTSAIRGNSPTFPYLQIGSAGVPAYHPENPFGEGVSFLGRAIGNGGAVSNNMFSSETYRMNVELTGSLSDTWSYDFGVTHAKNSYQIRTRDVVTANFQRALIGYGACDAGIGSVAPGTAGCEFYNPFATSYTTAPNSQNILDYVIGEQVIDGTSKTTVFDAVVSGSVGSLPAGDIGLALGIQVRDEFWGRDYDDISNADGFAFVIGNSDFGENRSAVGIFAESLVPITDKLDLSLALRHEMYGGDIGATTDPKVSLLFRPNDNLALRGSYSTSFRAPSVLQVSGGGTSLNQVTDPLGGTAFAAVRSVAPAGGRNIVPEQGNAWNFGATWSPEGTGLEIDVDYWNYKFSDVIIQENYQAVVNANPTDPTRVIRSGPDGVSGSIIMVVVDYLNASSVKTQGFDASVKYNMDTDMGTFMPFFEATHVLKYDLDDPQAGEIDGAGNRNFANFGSPTPKWRINTGLAWANENHDARFYVRHISGMDDDQNPGNRVGSMTTVDAQYTLQLSAFSDGLEGSSLQLGVINAFDKAPPYVMTNGGYESRTHDPRGRMVYAKIVASF